MGAGASGTVFSAIHPETSHEVAVKIIHRHLAEDPEIQEAFLKEISRIAGLKHPSILPLEAVGQFDSGEIFVISDISKGLPLTDLMSDSGPLPMVEAIPLLDSIAEILGDLHDQGMVHGNLSPENIWLDPREEGRWPPTIQILDFGMSLLHKPQRMEDEARSPYYLSPEQIRGEEPEISTDVYAFGVMAYQMLTGRLPFSSPRLGEVLLMHLNDDPPPPGDIVPMNPETELFLFQALSKDPNYRFKDMHQVRESILVILPLSQKVSAVVPSDRDKLPAKLASLSNAEEAEELPEATAVPPPLSTIGDEPTLPASKMTPLGHDSIEDGPTDPLGKVGHKDSGAVEIPPLAQGPIEDGPTPVFTYKSLSHEATGKAPKAEIKEIDLDQHQRPDEQAHKELNEVEHEQIEEVRDEDVEEVSPDDLTPTPTPLATLASEHLGPVEDDEPTWRRADSADRPEASGIIVQDPSREGDVDPEDQLVIVAEEVTGKHRKRPQRETPSPPRRRRTTPPEQLPARKKRRHSGKSPAARGKRPGGPPPPSAAELAGSATAKKKPGEEFDLEEICFSGPHDQTRDGEETRPPGFIPQSAIPLLSALAGIVTALSMGVVGYWLVTGHWPFPLGQ